MLAGMREGANIGNLQITDFAVNLFTCNSFLLLPPTCIVLQFS